MKMIFSLVSFLFFYVSVALATTADLEARQSTGCQITHFDYEVPANITNGVPFPVKFCSATYFKTSTKNIYFTWAPISNVTDGAHPLLQMDPNLSNGYEFNATVTYTIDTLNQYIYLGVLETINDYYTPAMFQWYVQKVWISTPPNVAGK